MLVAVSDGLSGNSGRARAQLGQRSFPPPRSVESLNSALSRTMSRSSISPFCGRR